MSSVGGRRRPALVVALGLAIVCLLAAVVLHDPYERFASLRLYDHEGHTLVGRQVVIGNGPERVEIRVYLDGREVGRVRRPFIDLGWRSGLSDPRWSLYFDVAKPGVYTVTADAYGLLGNKLASSNPLTYTITELAAPTLDERSSADISAHGTCDPHTYIRVVIDGLTAEDARLCGGNARWSSYGERLGYDKGHRVELTTVDEKGKPLTETRVVVLEEPMAVEDRIKDYEEHYRAYEEMLAERSEVLFPMVFLAGGPSRVP